MADTELLYTSLTVTHATNTHPSIVSVIQRIKIMKSSRICLIGYLGFISKMYSLRGRHTDSGGKDNFKHKMYTWFLVFKKTN